MSRFLLGTILILGISAFSFISLKENNFNLALKPTPETGVNLPPVNPPVSPKDESAVLAIRVGDEPNQKPLPNPPQVVKAIYATSWSAGSTAKMNYLIDLIKKTELNAIVIDIKDFSGAITYDIQLPEAIKYKAREVRTPNLNALIKKLHENNIYVIARVTVFQDPILAKARPDLAVKNSKTGANWADRKGISWIDPGSIDAWKYIVAIAKDASARGFDEINFDYIRFPSDGDLSVMQFPNSNLKVESKSQVIKRFFAYLRENLPGIKISADLFGLTVINKDDLGIGQIIEYAYQYFDYVAPMIYPSHFASGFGGYKNPAEYPYQVIQASMQNAVTRLMAFNNSQSVEVESGVNGQLLNVAKLRPWLQDFNLGATYDAAKVKAQIRATLESFCVIKRTAITVNQTTKDKNGNTIVVPKTQYKQTCEPLSKEDFDKTFGGWMLWDPRNNYTKAALSTVDN